MRRIALTALLVIVAAGSVYAKDLPSRATYRIYIYGQYAGKSEITITEKKDVIQFKSTSEVQFGEFLQKLESETLVDKATSSILHFKFDGLKGELRMAGELWARNDSITGSLTEGENTFPSSKLLSGQPIYFFENYIVEHQIMMTRMIAGSSQPIVSYRVLFPSSFIISTAAATMESEVLLDDTLEPTYCLKYQISIQQSAPYLSYYDPDRAIPVYLDFPAASTEIFLETAWGTDPPMKYTRPPEGQ